MTPAERLAHELRDAAARLRRIPTPALRNPIALVEWLSDEAKGLDRAAELLSPRRPLPRSPAAIVVETRFATGTVAHRGRLVRVETRQRRTAA